ncbi:MFS transporter [Alicyclobacillus fodiniaquatilis]|uniref:MFS transporter n=1 Tax=Alicyclobacillus fodiniaquatilis TaxID=1661150 RepID=A0ABW4JFW6_9BACL
MNVLRNKNYTILLIGQLVSTYGNNLYTLALPWYIYTITNSKSDLTIVGLADYIPALAGFFAGVLVDRWHKKTIMIASDLIRTLLALSISLVVSFHHNFMIIFGLALLIQLTGSFFTPASSALTPLLVSEDDLPKAMGITQATNGAVQLIGMTSGGSLLAIFKASRLFLIDSATFVISVISLLLIQVYEHLQTPQEHSNYLKEWSHGIRILIKSRSMLQIFLGGLISNFGLAPAIIVLTAWIKGPMGAKSTAFGIIAASMIIGLILGGILLGAISRLLSTKHILQVGLMVLGICLSFIAIWPNTYWCMGMILLGGFAISCLNGALRILLVKIVPQTMRGRIFSMFNGLMILASPVGIAVFGALMVIIPLWAVWVTMGSIIVLGGMSYFIRVRDDLHELMNTITELN